MNASVTELDGNAVSPSHCDVSKCHRRAVFAARNCDRRVTNALNVGTDSQLCGLHADMARLAIMHSNNSK